MNFEIGLGLFIIIMGLAVIVFAVVGSSKATGSAKGLPTPPLIVSQALLGVICVTQLAHYIIRRPTDGVGTAAAVILFVAAVSTFLALALLYRKLYRRFLFPEVNRER